MAGNGYLLKTKGRSPGPPSPDLPFPRDWFRSDTSAGRTASRHLFTFPSESARKTCQLWTATPRSLRVSSAFGLHFPGILAPVLRSVELERGGVSSRLCGGLGRALLAQAQGLRLSLGRGSPTPRNGHGAHFTFAKPSWTFPNPRLIPNPGNNGISHNPCFSLYYF